MRLFVAIISIMLVYLSSSPLIIHAQVVVTRIATGLENPRGIAILPDGRLLVVEAGTGLATLDPLENTGKLSIFDDINGDGDYDDEGEITRIFSHFYSYNTLTRFHTGHDEVGGAGDIIIIDDGRIFITQDDAFEGIGLMQITPEFRVLNSIFPSNATLNAIAYDSQEQIIYVAESGLNRLSSITLSGEKRLIAEFPLLAHSQQAVPSGLTFDPRTGEIVVALFSGQVFDYYGNILSYMPSDSKVVRVNPDSGEISDVIRGLTTAVDVAVDEDGNLFVAELSTRWPPAWMPRDFDLFGSDTAPDDGGYARFSGRVSMYPADGREPIILADGLDEPTNLTYHEGVLYVSIGQGTPRRSIIGSDGRPTQIVGEIYRISNFQR